MLNRISNKEDKRYQMTEKKILAAIRNIISRFNNRLYITNYRISRESGLHPDTIYKHHTDANELAKYYEENIGRDIQAMMESYYDKNSLPADYNRILKKYFEELMRYIMSNSDFFELEETMQSIRIWQKLLDISRPLITRCWGTYDAYSERKLFKAYSSTISMILSEWGKKKFSRTYIDVYYDYIIMLTLSAPQSFKWAIMEYLPP